MRHVLVVSRWHKLVDGLRASSLDSYTALEACLARRRIPETGVSRITWSEGGIGSAYRVYLKVQRGNLTFYICAAPFGESFFFSWWLTAALPRFGFLLLIALLLFSVIAFGAVMNPEQFFALYQAFPEPIRWMSRVGVPWWATQPIVGAVSALMTALLFIVLVRASAGVEAVLSIPVVGWFYEQLFHPLTFYRYDTVLMFRDSVHRSVLEVLDGLLNEQGLRALSPEEREPHTRDLLR